MVAVKSFIALSFALLMRSKASASVKVFQSLLTVQEVKALAGARLLQPNNTSLSSVSICLRANMKVVSSLQGRAVAFEGGTKSNSRRKPSLLLAPHQQGAIFAFGFPISESSYW